MFPSLLRSLFKEDGKSKTLNVELIQNDLELLIKKALLDAHPKGSIYWSFESTDPGELFGGTWEQITDKFIYAVGNKTVGAIGGEETHQLSVAELPVHNHTASSNETGSHQHINKIYNTNSDFFTMSIDAIRLNSGTSAYAWVEKGGTTAGGSGGDQCGITENAGSHKHTITVDNTGSGTAHNNMPPYITAYCWKRVA